MLIELKDVNKTYFGAQPLHVLKGINLGIERGEFVSIMGASGSGKSTLLNILGILDNYDSGEYRINGKLIWNLTESKAAEYRNKMIGFIFQSYNLIGFKTAVENVELPLFYQGVSRHKRHEKLDGHYIRVKRQGVLVSLLVHVRHIGSHHRGSAAHAKVTYIIFLSKHGAEHAGICIVQAVLDAVTVGNAVAYASHTYRLLLAGGECYQ